MRAILWRTSDLFAALGGVILVVIVAVTTTNTTAFILDRLAGLFGRDVAGLPGYEDFVQLAISGAALMFFPFCQANRGHVAVDLVMQMAPAVLRRTFDRAWLAVTCGVALFLAYWMVFGLLEAKSDGVVMAVLGWAVWPFYIPGILAMILWGAVALSQMFGEVRHA
jgi:TRAP-type C4-dicarboxylate transport system permease small subunit